MEEDRVGGGGEMMEMEAYTYKECMRNHAAALGTYATDGCGEYIPLLSDPTSLRCEACGCHRNFHRKVMPEEPLSLTCGGHSSPEGGGKRRQRTKFTVEQKEEMLKFADKIGWRIPRKDARNGDADDVNNFCVGIGVSRKIFKVWMHNHKSSSSSASSSLVAGGGNSLGAGGVSHVGDSSPL